MKKVVGETKTLKEGCTLGKRVDVFKGGRREFRL